MIFAGDFKDGGEWIGKGIHAVTDTLSNLEVRVNNENLGTGESETLLTC